MLHKQNLIRLSDTFMFPSVQTVETLINVDAKIAPSIHVLQVASFTCQDLLIAQRFGYSDHLAHGYSTQTEHGDEVEPNRPELLNRRNDAVLVAYIRRDV